MGAQLIDGKLIAQQVREEVAAAVAKRVAAGKSKPTLATVVVGNRVDSQSYVRNKGKACEELGMGSVSHALPEETSQEELETAHCRHECRQEHQWHPGAAAPAART